MVNNLVIALGAHQRDSGINIYVSILPQTTFLSGLPHNIEVNSLCCTISVL